MLNYVGQWLLESDRRTQVSPGRHLAEAKRDDCTPPPILTRADEESRASSPGDWGTPPLLEPAGAAGPLSPFLALLDRALPSDEAERKGEGREQGASRINRILSQLESRQVRPSDEVSTEKKPCSHSSSRSSLVHEDKSSLGVADSGLVTDEESEDM